MGLTANDISPERESELSDALGAVRARMETAAAEAGRPPSEIELLPITKFFPASDVAILARLGCRAFGESREQDAAAKAADLAAFDPTPLRWHMVGNIQRNKARSIASWAYAVHSVSSTRAVEALSRAAARALDEGERTAPLKAYVQLSLDGDVSRGGVDIHAPGAVDEVCDAIAGAEGLELVGLMTVPPMGADPDEAFGRLEAEHQRVLRFHPQATALSAGMSGDLESAIQHGSTCVRVGTALLGQRPLTSP